MREESNEEAYPQGSAIEERQRTRPVQPFSGVEMTIGPSTGRTGFQPRSRQAGSCFVRCREQSRMHCRAWRSARADSSVTTSTRRARSDAPYPASGVWRIVLTAQHDPVRASLGKGLHFSAMNGPASEFEFTPAARGRGRTSSSWRRVKCP